MPCIAIERMLFDISVGHEYALELLKMGHRWGVAWIVPTKARLFDT